MECCGAVAIYLLYLSRRYKSYLGNIFVYSAAFSYATQYVIYVPQTQNNESVVI